MVRNMILVIIYQMKIDHKLHYLHGFRLFVIDLLKRVCWGHALWKSNIIYYFHHFLLK